MQREIEFSERKGWESWNEGLMARFLCGRKKMGENRREIVSRGKEMREEDE